MFRNIISIIITVLCLGFIDCTEQEPDVDMFNDHYIFTEYDIYNKFNIIGVDGGKVDDAQLQQYYFDEDTQTLIIDDITIPSYMLYSFMTKEKYNHYYLFGRHTVDPSDNKKLSFMRVSPYFACGKAGATDIKLVSCDAKGKAKIEIYYNNGDKYKEIILKPGQQYSYTLEDGKNCVIKHHFIKKENVILY
jgi:hypothetical protein